MLTTTTTSAEKNLAVGHWMWPLNSLERVQRNLIQHSPFLFCKVSWCSVELTLVFQGAQGNCQCQKLCNFQDHPREEKLLAASIVSLHSSFSFCGKMYHAQVTLVRFFPLMKHVLVYDSFVTFGIQYSACTDASLGQLTALFLFMQT